MSTEDIYVFRSDDLPIRSYVFFKAKRRQFCDITFNVGERTISAHRMILSAAIPYFYKIFFEREVPDSHEKVITFPDINPDALESLIDFAYTCQVEINEENVKSLMFAAGLLEVDHVRDECFRFLVNRLNSKNVLRTRDFLCQLCSSEELEEVDSYIRGNFEEVSHSTDFSNLPFDLLKSITGHDDLKVNSEDCVFEIIMKWVKHCPEERKHHLPHLLSNVRMPLIKPSYMKNNILKEELIRTSTECRDLIDEAIYFHFVPEEREEVCSFISRQRSLAADTQKKITDEISRIYIIYSNMEHTVGTLDSESGIWKSALHCKFVLEHKYTAAELNKKLYFFLPNLTYVYDLERNIFMFCKGMKVPRHWAGAVSQSNKLYVLGGCVSGVGPNSQSNVAECFDPNADEWTHLTELNICRGAPGVVAWEQFIYVLGGKVADSCTVNSVERYDVNTRMWTIMPRMLSNRCASSCAVLKEKIYVCGGQLDSGEITPTAEVFDLIMNKWISISPMTVGRICCKLIAFCGKLYCLGGKTDKGSSNTVEIYDLEGNEWKNGPSTKENLVIVGAAVINVTSV